MNNVITLLNIPDMLQNSEKIKDNADEILKSASCNQIERNCVQFLTKILRLENGAKECIM